MLSDPILPTVRQLINRHIRSMDHAEAAIHLARVPGESHATDAVAAQHHWAAGIAMQVLEDLVTSGLAVRTGGGYQLADDVPAEALAGFIRLYHTQPVTLVRAIYSAPVTVKPPNRPTDPGSARL